ncbi:hypothetical protein BYT27DRAFT_6493440 [Phlegmacium glaucopus]|nr:hypothetical protein BYT27DRAFT_6493440 [Phlegmacium glaucopus]
MQKVSLLLKGDHNLMDSTSTQCYFTTEGPIVYPNSSTRLVSSRPLANASASSAAGYAIYILQQINNTIQFPSIPPIMNKTIVPKKPFGKQSKRSSFVKIN